MKDKENQAGAFTLRFPVKVFGVDFSGSAKAGNHIHISAGTSDGERLRIERCFPARELPGAGENREDAFNALGKFVAQQANGIFGMDFPFSIPRNMIPENTWEEFAVSFAERFPSPDDFRRYCRSFSVGGEIKRLTDRESRAPFSPYNLRIYRQTYYGIRDFLAPLVQQDQARVIPLQSPQSEKPWILEVCPASILKRLNLYAPYKGKGKRELENRRKILDFLVEKGEVYPDNDALLSILLEDRFGDALDSLLAAFIVHSLLGDIPLPATIRRPEYLIEGLVYY